MHTCFLSGAPHRRQLVFLCVAVLLDGLALGMVRPVLPGLVRSLSGGDAVLGARMFGLAETGWALVQLLLAPFWGVLADRVGRRPPIVVSNVVLGFDYVLMALTPDLTLLMVSRAMCGVVSGTFCAGAAFVADITRPGERAVGFGVLGAAIGVGFGLGPMLGGFLGGFDPRLPFWAAAGLILVNIVWTLFILPESLPPERRRPMVWRRAHPLGALRFLSERPALFRLSMLALLAFVALEAMPAVFVLFAQHRFGWSPATVGLALSSVGIGLGLVQAGLVPPVVGRFGERRAVLIGLAAGAVGLAALGLVPDARWVWLCIPVIVVWGIFVPSVQSLMTGLAAKSEQGLLHGAIGSLHTLSKLIAFVLFPQLFAVAIAPGLPVPLAGAPFVLAALFLVGALAVAPRLFRDGPQAGGAGPARQLP